MAQVALCSQINTKHINTVWAERTVVECKTGGASRNQYALKGYYLSLSSIDIRPKQPHEYSNIHLFLIFSTCFGRQFVALKVNIYHYLVSKSRVSYSTLEGDS